MVGDVRLLERQDQLDALAHYWADAKGGRGRLVLVGGEAGVGKTALIEEFIGGTGPRPRRSRAAASP